MSKKGKRGDHHAVAAGLIRARYAVTEVAGHGPRGHKEHKLISEILGRLNTLILEAVNKADD